ncbi:TonB family protein [Myxococcota bacterium]|nr:TonB family protein [Myxococcota bacterium]
MHKKGPPHLLYVTLLTLLLSFSPKEAWSRSPLPNGDTTKKKVPKTGAKPKIEYPKLKKFVPAPYPNAMRKAGKEGIVKLILSLDDKGVVIEVKVAVSAGKAFDDAAVAAAKQWLFEPAKLDGTPIPSKIPISYPFKLKNKGTTTKTPTKKPACDPKTDPTCKPGRVTLTKTTCDPKKDPTCKDPTAIKPACDPKTDPACKVDPAVVLD